MNLKYFTPGPVDDNWEATLYQLRDWALNHHSLNPFRDENNKISWGLYYQKGDISCYEAHLLIWQFVRFNPFYNIFFRLLENYLFDEDSDRDQIPLVSIAGYKEIPKDAQFEFFKDFVGESRKRLVSKRMHMLKHIHKLDAFCKSQEIDDEIMDVVPQYLFERFRDAWQIYPFPDIPDTALMDSHVRFNTLIRGEASEPGHKYDDGIALMGSNVEFPLDDIPSRVIVDEKSMDQISILLTYNDRKQFNIFKNTIRKKYRPQKILSSLLEKVFCKFQVHYKGITSPTELSRLLNEYSIEGGRGNSRQDAGTQSEEDFDKISMRAPFCFILK